MESVRENRASYARLYNSMQEAAPEALLWGLQKISSKAAYNDTVNTIISGYNCAERTSVTPPGRLMINLSPFVHTPNTT